MTQATHSNWQATACNLCSLNCGIEIEVDRGAEKPRFKHIRGDRNHPTSQGYLCQKASRLDYYQNHAGRLTHPLRRTPDGSFEKIDWDTAIREVAAKLGEIRKAHGGHAIAYYGGGGQGNHLGGAYAVPFRAALGTPYIYNSLAQEKTGDFWVNGKLFGRQTCHVTEGIEESDFVIIIGANPWQAHGIPRARQVIREIGKDPNRTLVVVDPRRTETAELADVHLQVRPGTDAFLMAALLAVIVQEGLEDREFLARRTTGHEELFRQLAEVPVDEYAERAGVEADLLRKIARGFAAAESACTRHDLGVEHSLHSTLNTYLEKLLSLVTGNFGREGGNNLHTQLVPLIGHSREPGAGGKTTRVTGMREISKFYPPNILPAEIDTDHPERIRALIVDSSNPMQTAADTGAYGRAFEKLELLVAIDVADTETVRLADYVLPAPSQYEKWEATFFTLSFPTNYFHLRRPIVEPSGDTLAEPEIYRRLMVAMGELPARFPILEAVAKLDRRMPALGLFPKALAATLALRPRLKKVASLVLYSTLGRALAERVEGAAAAAAIWGSCQFYARRHPEQVRRAGHRGDGTALGESLFQAILASETAVPISTHTYDEMWTLVRHDDGKIHLEVPEMLEELGALRDESTDQHLSADFPFVLASGERRSYNANQIYRDPEWRRRDREGALRIHPEDAERLGFAAGQLAVCQSRTGSVEVVIQPDDSVRPGCLSLPHGYGQTYRGQGGDEEQNGPRINRLTSSDHCDPIAKTPYHKYVPVRLVPLTTDGLRAT
ncbi:MAG: molybdopterin-dependent oxidoreductase [bacterium]|nr:molybdopterin-dependent oxidoreductase [bacterium]